MTMELSPEEEKKFKKYLEEQEKKKSKPSIKDEDPVIFKEVQTSDRNKLVISRNTYKGRESLRIQNFYLEDDDWRFGKAISFHYENIEEIIEGLQEMQTWCEDNLGEDN